MTIEQTKKKVEKMISERDAEIATLRDSVVKESAEIETAESAMNAASTKNDLTAYKRAKGQKQDAADAREMHQTRLKKLTDEPLITEEEYQGMLKDLTSEMDKEVKDAQPKLKDASDQLASIGAQVSTDAAQVNDLMKTIQHQLFRDKDRKKNSNGMFIGNPKSYGGHFNVCGWSKAGIDHFMYTDYVKGQSAERKGSHD